MKALVLAVKRTEFPDRFDNTKKVVTNKVTCLVEEGVVELWSNKELNKDDTVELGIKAGSNYKPKVYIK